MLWPLAVIPVATISNKWLLVFFLGFPPNTLGNWGLVTLNKICSWTFCLPLLLIYHQFKKKCDYFLKVYFIFWLCWVFSAAWALSSCGERGILSHRGAWTSHCDGFSFCAVQALECAPSVAEAPRLQSTGTIVVPHVLCCSTACGIFLDQGLNPCLLSQFIINELILKKNNFVIIIFSLMKTLLLLVVPCGVWDHSSLTRNQTCAPCLGSTESQLLDDQGKPITELILLHVIISLYTVVGGKRSDTFVKSRFFFLFLFHILFFVVAVSVL